MATPENVAEALNRTYDETSSPYTLKIDVVEGMDRFACEGPLAVVERLYAAWIKRLDSEQKETADLFVRAKQASAAEAMLNKVGIDTKRLS